MKSYAFSVPIVLFLINFLFRFFIEKKFWDKIHIGSLLSLQSASFVFGSFILYKFTHVKKAEISSTIKKFFSSNGLGDHMGLLAKIEEILKPMVKSFQSSEGVIIYGGCLLVVYFFMNFAESHWRGNKVKEKTKMQNRERDIHGRYLTSYKIWICGSLALGFITALSIPFFYFYPVWENLGKHLFDYFKNYVLVFLITGFCFFSLIAFLYYLAGQALDPPRPDWSKRTQSWV